MKCLIGIDVGTQSLRACAFRLDGHLIAKEIVPFNSTSKPAPSQAEQDPMEWWNAAIFALKRIANNPNIVLNDIVALSYACTSCTAVFLDENDLPVRPALLWMDHRATEEASIVQNTNSPVLPYSGSKVSPEWMFPKILWIKTHEPETIEKSTHIVEQIDFFTYKLTGKWTLGYNHLVAKWNYANPVGGWPDGFISELGLFDIQKKWPQQVVPIGSVVGTLDPKVCHETGLPEKILVVQGGMDSTAGMLGLGAFKVGQIGMSHGTSTVLQCQFDRFAKGLRGRPDALVNGLYLIGGGETSTGSVAQWLVKQLSKDSMVPYKDFYNYLEDEVVKIPPGSSGMVVLEHFQGSRSIPDPDSRGVIWGLTLWHTSAHILRAIYEGISFGVRRFLDQLTGVNYPIKRLSAGGGLMRSNICTQILADVCGLPIYLVEEKEQSALGAAIIAGTGAGCFSDFDEGIQKMVHFSDPVYPIPGNKSVYDFYYSQYLRTYDAMKDLMHNVVEFEREKTFKTEAEKVG